MKKVAEFWYKFKQPLFYGLVIFILGGFGGLFVQKHVAPFLASWPVLRNVSFLHASTPIVITNTEQIRVNENVRVRDLVKQLSSQVVTIVAGVGEVGENFEERQRMTGLVVSNDGILVTDKSLFDDLSFTTYVVVFDDGSVGTAELEVVDPKSNLAFVRTDKRNLSPVRFGNSFSLEAGQEVVVMFGSEVPNRSRILMSYISSSAADVLSFDVFSSENYRTGLRLGQQVSSQPGAGVFNLRGELVGFLNDQGDILPAEHFRSAQDQFFTNDSLERVSLGVHYSILNKASATLWNLPIEYGVMLRNAGQVPAVLPNTSAAEAGLQVFDVIVKINNEPLGPTRTLDILLDRFSEGDMAEFTVLRAGEEIALSVNF